MKVLCYSKCITDTDHQSRGKCPAGCLLPGRREQRRYSMVVKVTSDTFESEVLKSELPVLLDCYADWCGPCKMMSPVVDKMAELFDGKMKFCKLNVDEDGDAVMQYKVMSIPNFLFFRNGEVVHNAVGGMAPKQFQELIQKVIG